MTRVWGRWGYTQGWAEGATAERELPGGESHQQRRDSAVWTTVAIPGELLVDVMQDGHDKVAGA